MQGGIRTSGQVDEGTQGGKNKDKKENPEKKQQKFV
jgi:hypothetical protein